MTPHEAIRELEEMDGQMIHAKRRIFREIADVIRGLTMIEIPKIERNASGFPVATPCWEPWDTAGGKHKANLYCNKGHAGFLATHEIAKDGTVTPSCVCPKEGCGFHEHVRLVGWVPLALATLFVCLLGCKTPPSAPYAPDEVAPITEQPRESRPAPTAPPGGYVFYTNAADDRLIEQPPIPPGYGPFQVHRNPPAVSNWMTKASAAEPKPMTNQIPGSTILTKITTTDKDGKKFTAELTLIGDQTVYANDKMSLALFAIYQTNFVVEFCTNLTEGIWHTMSSGVGQNTNSALAIFDLHEGTKPVNFYRRKPAP